MFSKFKPQEPARALKRDNLLGVWGCVHLDVALGEEVVELCHGLAKWFAARGNAQGDLGHCLVDAKAGVVSEDGPDLARQETSLRAVGVVVDVD
eukprot:11308756-Alexandrium_andersonii.AAC.1